MPLRTPVLSGRAKGLRAALRHGKRRRELIALLPKNGVGAEVGVWKGDFTARLLRGAKPRKLFLIDPWQHSTHDGAWYAEKDDEEMARIREGVTGRFAREITRERVVVIPKRSQEAVGQLSALDWAYLDGDHTYEAVVADLRGFWPLILDGGCLAGDDYGIKGWWEGGVTRAVDEFAASIDRSPTIIGSQFLIRK
jgi:Methyltransferase domain